MKLVAGLFLSTVSLLATQGIAFTVTDGRGKETSAFTLEAGAPDADGWQPVRIARVRDKNKGEPLLVWPFDGLAKAPDGPEQVPAIIILKGDERTLSNRLLVAAIMTPILLGTSTLAEAAVKTGYSPEALAKAFKTLAEATGAFEKGAGLLYEGKSSEASEQLATALRERQRQLTRVPSDIYPAALLDGQALLKAGKFDEAAVAFLTAQKQRPSSEIARKGRREALIKAGKPEAE